MRATQLRKKKRVGVGGICAGVEGVSENSVKHTPLAFSGGKAPTTPVAGRGDCKYSFFFAMFAVKLRKTWQFLKKDGPKSRLKPYIYIYICICICICIYACSPPPKKNKNK